MASLVAILDLKGKPLIQRSYRDDVAASNIERFLPLILEMEEEGQPITPCFTNQGVNFTYIRHSNLYRQFKCSVSTQYTYSNAQCWLYLNETLTLPKSFSGSTTLWL